MTRLAFTVQALRTQITTHRRVRRQVRRAERDLEIVEVQLAGPAGMFPVLRANRLYRLRRQACAGAVGALAVAQARNRIVGRLAGPVEPPLNGGAAELDIVASDGMTPAFGGQRGDEFAHLPGFRRCCQQGAHDRKAQARPTIPQG
ncbi:hypothetical protein OKW39_008508 [Paraburkholderia sp. MM6662-R1]